MKHLATAILCALFLIETTKAVGTDQVRVVDEYLYGFGLVQKMYPSEGISKEEIFEVDRVECGGPAAMAQVRSGDLLFSITIRNAQGNVVHEPLTKLTENDEFRSAEITVIRPLHPIIARIVNAPMESERKILFSGPVTGENKCE